MNIPTAKYRGEFNTSHAFDNRESLQQHEKWQHYFDVMKAFLSDTHQSIKR